MHRTPRGPAPGAGHPYFDLEPTVSKSDDAIMIAEKIPELKSLSSEEKLILVGGLWDELAADPNAFPPREHHIKILRERLEHYRQHPEDVIAWENVKARTLAWR
jgi:putative addiction module component (TIGR02574 family)